MTEQIKITKLSDSLTKGDRIEIAGLECVVFKAEYIHFYKDDNFIRAEFTVAEEDPKSRVKRITVFFPKNRMIEILK